MRSARQLWMFTCFAGVLSALFVARANAQAPALDNLIIHNVRIFDGTKITADTDVWIEGGRIKAVGTKLKAPANVRGLDGSGETLLPGLIDAHTHVFADALKQALIFGVTTELDMFTSYEYAAKIKAEQAKGQDLDMADLRSAGTLVTAPKGHGTEYGLPIPTITSPAEAQAFVDARIAEGSDYIKIIYDGGTRSTDQIPTISKETMAAVVAAAHKRGKLTVAHIDSLRGAKDAIQAGVDGLAHLFVDAPGDREFVDLAARHHIFVVPTLSVLENIAAAPAGKTLVADERLQPYLTPETRSNLVASFPFHAGSFDNAQATIRLLQARHVPILAGTDAPNPGTAHGPSLHGELELLVGAGMTPLEALTAATSAPAAAFHLDDRGVIAPGKRADLILVKGNPTADITATRDIVTVWKAGVEDDRAAWRAMVAKANHATEAQKTAPAPAGSESGLISDFDDGKPSAKFGLDWQVSTDSFRGGKSTAELKVIDGGAEKSRGALQIAGEIVENPVSWAGAIFYPGKAPMAPANLSSKKALTFFVKGDARPFCVMLFTASGGFVPKTVQFNAGPDWQKITLPFSRFDTDGHDLMGLFIGAWQTAGRFTLVIDDVRLE